MTAARPVSIDQLVAGRSEDIVVSDIGATRLLVFNRAERRNAMSAEMRRTFAAEISRASADPAVHCLILTGAHGFFSAGVDIKERDLGGSAPLIRPHPVEAARASTKPIIAMIDGPCITGGLELAMACTFVVASDRSSFADTHLKIGIYPGWGGIALLASAIGARRAAQMQLSGERISATTACEWGLANEVCPADALLARCLDLGETFAALDPARRERFVAFNRRINDMDLDQALRLEEHEVTQVRALPRKAE